MRTLFFLVCLLLPVPLVAAAPTPTETIILQNPLFRWSISANATNVSFVDCATGRDYLRRVALSTCAQLRLAGRELPATAAAFADGRLSLGFGTNAARAVIKVDPQPYCILLTVESVSDMAADGLVFLNIPLTLKAVPSESFGACALSLNLFTRVDSLPALQTDLVASCEKKFGIVGAKVAIVAAPMERLLPALQQTLSQDSQLPVCKVAGPWAREIPFNHGSYLFNFGSLNETNVTDWIAMTRSLGFSQIDNHGGGEFFRFGDMELNRTKWPDGWDSWKRIVAALHAKGVGSIFHTYAFFIDKRSKYVTPVPDPRLDAFRVFTLAAPLTADATEITVREPTSEITTVTGFFEHNSVVLHLGDELVTFAGASKEPPWRFTGVKRGALGTHASAHESGAKARHLKECFGLFVPNVETSLLEEIAANHAEVVNHCDFDGIYLDAIDGSSILRGSDECWYWANKFVVEIQKRLKRPVGMEMSAMWHHFWQYRTRWQAWDYPQRGHKRFIDLHAEGVNGGLLLPLHLGWWGFQSFNPPQVEPSYPDVMENLAAKLIGWDAGISLTAGVDRETLRKTPLFQRAATILRTCEELRQGNVFSEPAKAELREPGREFSMVQDASGKTRFQRTQSYSHTLAVHEPWTLSWSVSNLFETQPARFRLEALMSTSEAGASNAVVIADLRTATNSPWKRTSAEGVFFTLVPAMGAGGSVTTLVATNSGKVPQNGAWVRLELPLAPLQNLKDRQGLGVEIEGDGSGALLAIRLESPRHISFGAVADRYVVLDFVGRRFFHLVETESARWSDYVWNDGKGLYNLYRETIDFGVVESVSVWLQNLPPQHETRCRIGPIQALPLVAGTLKHPQVVVGGKSITFPIELKSGSWIECDGPDQCLAYGPKGEPLGKVAPAGEWPSLPAGTSTLEFRCEPVPGLQPRARLTLFTHGAVL